MATKLKNFTPLIDEVVEDVGYMTAMVYGVVFRYAQMSKNKCTASAETIAGRINASEKTVRRHLKTLTENGYIIDLTPNRRNAPHEYKLTEKAGITIHITGDGETESSSENDEDGDGLVTESMRDGQKVQARLVTESNEETLIRNEERNDSKSAASVAPPDEPECAQPVQDDQRGQESQMSTPSEESESGNGTRWGKNNSQHPAIQAHRDVIRRYVPIALRGDVIQTVGESEESVKRWREVVKGWLGMGWKPTNVSGMLDCYRRGEVPGVKRGGTNGNGAHEFSHPYAHGEVIG